MEYWAGQVAALLLLLILLPYCLPCLVSLALAGLALHRLLRDRIGNGAATWAVVFFAAGPIAAMFQVAKSVIH